MAQKQAAWLLRPQAPHRPLPRYELHCTVCGYGVVVRVAPERCPMCGSSGWEHVQRRHRRPPQSPSRA